MNLTTTLKKGFEYLKKGTFTSALTRKLFESKLKFLVNTRIYNKLYKNLISKKVKYVSYPQSINIETTNKCNANCEFCPRTDLNRKKEVMTFHTFKIIIDKLIKENTPLTSLCINGFGEPLLDHTLFKKIKYVKDNTRYSVIFFTNGQLLNENNAGKCISSGLDELNISFNAMFKKEYEQTMKLNYDITVNNIKRLFRIRNKKKSSTPRIYLSCVYSRKTKFDKTKFKAMWEPFVDSIFIMPAEIFGELTEKEAFSVEEYGHIIKKWPCFRLWKNAWISVTGDVHLCCKDINGNFIVGNIFNNSLAEIWNNDKFNLYRSYHLNNEFGKISICKNCEVLVRSSTGWWF